MCLLRCAVLTVLWIGFCHTGPILLCVDLFVLICVYFVCSCFILHSYCIIVSMVGWTWWDWSLIRRTYLLSVLWHCWLGHLTSKSPSLVCGAALCYRYCSNIVLHYVSDDDDNDADETAADDGALASHALSTSVSSCSLGAAIAARAHSCGATQQYSDPCQQESHHRANAFQSSVPTHRSPSLLTRQQVCMILCLIYD